MKKLYENKEPRKVSVSMPESRLVNTNQPIETSQIAGFDNYFLKGYRWIKNLFKKKGIEDEIKHV